jgi:hypothetical protein
LLSFLGCCVWYPFWSVKSCCKSVGKEANKHVPNYQTWCEESCPYLNKQPYQSTSSSYKFKEATFNQLSAISIFSQTNQVLLVGNSPTNEQERHKIGKLVVVDTQKPPHQPSRSGRQKQPYQYKESLGVTGLHATALFYFPQDSRNVPKIECVYLTWLSVGNACKRRYNNWVNDLWQTPQFACRKSLPQYTFKEENFEASDGKLTDNASLTW